MFSAAGCTGIGPNTTYYMGTTSFNYDPTSVDYMLKLNGQEIGGGFGGAMSTNSIKNWYSSHYMERCEKLVNLTLQKSSDYY